MGHRISKGLPLALAFIFMAFALSGCGSTQRVVDYEEISREVTTITFFGNKYEPENVTVIEEILSGFMKENPDIRVSYESLKGNAYYEALEKRMKAGKGSDVFMVNHDMVLKLQESGQLYDLSSLDTIDAYTDQMLSQMDEQGKIYWVPTTVSVFGLFCNKDLLEKHHQEIPANLAEWERVCDYFVSEGITPVIANNDISLKTIAIGKGFYPAYQTGEQLKVFRKLNSGEEHLGTYLTPGFAMAGRWLEKGYIDPEKALVTNKTSDDLMEFAKGEAPFMLTGAWTARRVKAMKPDFAFEVAPYPILEDGSLVVINADTRLSVNGDSPHIEEAMRFVAYFTRQENIEKFADQQAAFSPLKGGFSSSLQEIKRLVSCYEQGRTVIGSDDRLDLPIWNLTAEASRQLLSGERLETVIDILDE